MNLLSIEDIRIGLDKEFLLLEPDLDGLRLIPSVLSEAELSRCETQLEVKFPFGFREIISNYDFGRLTIGTVMFSNKGSYLEELLFMNGSVVWWNGEKERPRDFLMIATSDPYIFLLNVKSGKVYAFDRETGHDSKFCVAVDFTRFFQGIGTVFLMRGKEGSDMVLGEKVSAEVGSDYDLFWISLAS